MELYVEATNPKVIVDEHNKTVSVSVQVRAEHHPYYEEDANQAFFYNYTATGSSRAADPDKFDLETGIQIALGRAYRQLGRNLLADGQDAVHERDRVRRAQREAAIVRKVKKDFVLDTVTERGVRETVKAKLKGGKKSK